MLESAIAQRLLASAVPARLAYRALDGTPRVLPMWFHWTGTELVLATHVPSHEVDALAADPASPSPSTPRPARPRRCSCAAAPSSRRSTGWCRSTRPPPAGTSATSTRPAGLVAQVDRPGSRMARIAVRPTWVGVLDFQTWFPGNFPAALR